MLPLCVLLGYVCFTLTVWHQAAALEAGTTFPYTISPGFYSSCGYNVSTVEAHIKNTSTYECDKEPHLTENLISSGYLQQSNGHQSAKRFHKDIFLNHLRHKTLVIVGDSVGLQLFNGISNELVCEETYRHNGNGTYIQNPRKLKHGREVKNKMSTGKKHW